MRNRILPVHIYFTLAILACIPSLAPNAGAQSKYKVLYSFTGGTDGGGVNDSVVFDTKGNIYGTTTGGGAYGYGTVFELSPTTQGPWTETVLHSFPYPSADGAEPNGNVIFDAAGNLYGTTCTAGANGRGTIFEMTPGSSGWTFNVLYNFGSQSGDGGCPKGGLTLDKVGNLYATSGVVFELSPGSGGWTDSILYTFSGGSDGGVPFAGVFMNSAGNLFGTTYDGGTTGAGVVYEVRHASSGWMESVLHSFSGGRDGAAPGWGQLVADGAGSLYGTTAVGGSGIGGCFGGGCGTIFKLTRGPHGGWVETILYRFHAGAAGFSPQAGVVLDHSGNLYGTTLYGGSASCGCGAVYKLAPGSGGTWTYSVLHAFVGTDGSQPVADLTLHNGKLFGTTTLGGPGGVGTVFELAP
jgi:uncharacterized repeat protein (TIGR03803 family)